MFSFWKKKEVFAPYKGPIFVFVRHCVFSSISQHKKRPLGFSREICHANLLQELGSEKITYFLDRGFGGVHFLDGREGVVECSAGSEARSFLALIEFVKQLSLASEAILYFVEDDYLHRPGALQILREGFEVPGADYVTLYDHRDKYFCPMYQKLESKIFASSSCHWRSTPSTTNTFAVRYGTLMSDLPVHRKFSKGRKITADHQKFCALRKKGRMLISSIPGWSTHSEAAYASPCFDWEKLLQSIEKGVYESHCPRK